MTATCPVCAAPIAPRSRFCPTCGHVLPQRLLSAPSVTPLSASSSGVPPVEVVIPAARRIHVGHDQLNLRELINVVESSVRYWQAQQAGTNTQTRAQAAQSIAELSQILTSLSQQLALGRETIRITKRLPALRTFEIGCPACGAGNRAQARYCLRCGRSLTQAPVAVAAPLIEESMRLNVGARTDTGRVRKNNQDAIFTGIIDTPNGSAWLGLVADGMGGARAGEHASRITADVLRASLQHDLATQQHTDDAAWHEMLRNAARAANRRVYEDSRSSSDRHGMGTTLTVALIIGRRLHLASGGGSRAYLINSAGGAEKGALGAPLPPDHSLVARLVDIGQITAEEARTHPQRNVLYRSIGTDPTVDIDTRSAQLEPGDCVLLCSDGLVGHVRDEELTAIVLAQPDPDLACEQLVTLANTRGGRDNISVVLIRIE
ncbi:MAG TPA: protein phosphatase 2C domain-containing protein [Roseiflexaceae bacterium]|nr:protein phosphatase 2C domain-containing protein [Roseiflexaceae bacterium]